MGRDKSSLMGWESKRQRRCKEREHECSQRAVLNNGLYPTHPSNSLSHHPFPAGLGEPRTLLPGPGHFRTSPRPTKMHIHSLVSDQGFIRHTGSALECVLDCVLKRGISSFSLLRYDVISSFSPSVNQVCVHHGISGADMLQRRLLSVLLRVVLERPAWVDQSSVTGLLSRSCVKHNQASVERRCNDCLNSRDGSGSPTPPWLIVPDMLTQRFKNPTLHIKFCSLPKSGSLLVTFP